MVLSEKKRLVSIKGCVLSFALLAPVVIVYIFYIISMIELVFRHTHDSYIISTNFRFIYSLFVLLLTFQIVFLIFGVAIPNFLFPKRKEIGVIERTTRLLPVIIAIPGSIVLNFLVLEGLLKTLTEDSLDIVFYVLIGAQLLCTLVLASWIFGGGEKKTMSFACPYQLDYGDD